MADIAKKNALRNDDYLCFGIYDYTSKC